MKFTYISHKKTMSITLFIYRRCLEIVHKGLFLVLRLSLVCPSANLPANLLWLVIPIHMLSQIGQMYWKNCVWRNWNWLEKFIKAGPDTPVVKASRWNHDTLKMLLWTFVYYDKRTRKENLLIAGDFDDKEPDGTDGNIELSPTTKYSMTSNLVKAVCELHYNS